jgi:quercetin dioxygenase-like cupin family protein
MAVTHEFVCNDLDVSQLKQELLSHYEEFDKYDFRRTVDGSPHTEMTDIWVRYNDINPFLEKGSLDGFNSEHDSVWYPVLDKIPSAKKVALELMAKVEGERLGGVLITKLAPGGKIDRHTDAGWHAQYYDKFFVPIQIEKEATFGFDDGDIHAVEGEAWWFDNSNPHWVTNNTNCDRIAMIVCVRTEKYKDKNAHRI